MRRSLLFVFAAAASLSACATAIAPVEVTRFHRLSSPTATLAPGSYRIVPVDAVIDSADGDPANNNAVSTDRVVATPTLEWNSYAAAVARQLDTLGYTPVTANAVQGSESYRVTLAVGREERAVRERGPVNVGVGGSTGSYGSGVGVGVGINLNNLFGGGNGDIVGTRMQVRISRAGDVQPLWEGRAQTEARIASSAAQPGLAAQKLADALFRGFPGSSGETITVP